MNLKIILKNKISLTKGFKNISKIFNCLDLRILIKQKKLSSVEKSLCITFKKDHQKVLKETSRIKILEKNKD